MPLRLHLPEGLAEQVPSGSISGHSASGSPQRLRHCEARPHLRLDLAAPCPVHSWISPGDPEVSEPHPNPVVLPGPAALGTHNPRDRQRPPGVPQIPLSPPFVCTLPVLQWKVVSSMERGEQDPAMPCSTRLESLHLWTHQHMARVRGGRGGGSGDDYACGTFIVVRP